MGINKQTNIDDFLGTLLDQQPIRKKTQKQATSEITKETRIESYKQTGKQSLRKLVIEILGDNQLTAREMAVDMHKKGLIPYPARAVIQPRITELVRMGVIEVVGEKFDKETDRKVAVYKVV